MRFVQESGRIFGIIIMPAPEMPVHAFFVGATVIPAQQLPDNSLQKAYGRVFTLEASIPAEDGAGVLCEWNNEGHHIHHGLRVEINVAAFFRAVIGLLQPTAATPAPIASTSILNPTLSPDKPSPSR